MIKKIKQLFMTLSLSTLLVLPLAPLAVTHAQAGGGSAQEDSITGNLCSGVNLDATQLGEDASTTCAGNDQAGSRVNDIIKLVINVFSLIVGVVSVIMIIVGGLKYITSGGESGNITGAKNTILYALIGLVVVALAQIVVKFVLAKATQQ